MKLLVGVIVLGLVSSVSLAADEQIIQKISGNGTRSTRPFTVADRWEIRWEGNGDSLQIYEHRPNGEPVSFAPAATQSKPGTGSTYRPKGGDFYLRILANGDWTITVVQLP